MVAGARNTFDLHDDQTKLVAGERNPLDLLFVALDITAEHGRR